MNVELESDGQTIDAVFRRYDVGARVSRTPYTSFQSSAWNVFALERRKDTKVRDVVRIADELDEALTDIRLKPTQCRFETLPLRVLTPRRTPQAQNTVNVLRKYSDEARRRPGLHVMLGEVVGSRKAMTMIADMTQATMPHMLIAGTTGSGKTYQMMNIVLSLSALNNPGDLEIVVIDPKAVDMGILNGLPGMRHEVVQDLNDCVDALDDAVAEIDRRKERRMKDPRRRYVVVVDEIADLIAAGGKSVVASIERIVQVGRGVGVHFIGGTQKPTNEIFDSSVIKSNMPVRICGMVQSKNDANVATGTTDSGAERLSSAGSFVAVTAGGRIEMLTAYQLDEAQIRTLGGGVPPVPVYQRRKNADSDRVLPDFAPVQAVQRPVSVQTVHVEAKPSSVPLDFDLSRQPTRDEARIIRSMLRDFSKNAVIRQLWPTKNKQMCLNFIDAATQQQEVTV